MLQIQLTMERWRWMPSELVSAPIIVNIPQFRLFAFESTADSESHIRQMDVIVGKSFEATQTPVFTADMSYVVFRPYWEVPYSIALKEIVPGARNNPASIEKRQMEIVRGYGDSATVMPNTAANVELVAKGTLRLREKPGPKNSLGLVKFMLPNPYNVYLHSTPAQALFGQSRRDFSHGCVRVSDPVGLAQYVLRDSPEWTREKILAAMNGPSPQTVTLKNRIRVFIVYGTALATESGNVLFFDDIYGHDRRLEAALNARRARTAASTDSTAANAASSAAASPAITASSAAAAPSIAAARGLDILAHLHRGSQRKPAVDLMRVTLEHLRRYAVARSLFKPTTLGRAINKLGFVQADPIRAPARAQDLTLRHRVAGYQAGDLEERYSRLPIEEDFFVNYGFLPRASHALMHRGGRGKSGLRHGRRRRKRYSTSSVSTARSTRAPSTRTLPTQGDQLVRRLLECHHASAG